MRLGDFAFIVLLFVVASFVEAQPPPLPPVGGAASGQHKFAGHDEVRDADHIKQHLQDQIDVNELELNEEQKRFHYFSMHDLNKDNRIDGNEIIKAMVHEHDREAMADIEKGQMSEAALESLTDSILHEIDSNNDGFVDYGEYVKNLD